jgi:HK97 family phage prohead protease
MPAKQFASMSVKGLQDNGSFEGILASYNTVDLGGDKIMPGAFTKTMQERGSEVPMLWQHNPDEPIGTLKLSDSSEGLMVKGQILMELDHGRKAHILLKAGVIKGLSIGYTPIKKETVDGNRILKEVKLYEGSVVTFPMNEHCMVTAVKKDHGEIEVKDDFNGELSTIQLQEAGYQMMSALFSAIGSTVWGGGLSKDEILSGVQTVIDQFSSGYMSYLPLYLDYILSESDVEVMSRAKAEEKFFSGLLAAAAKDPASEMKKGAVHSAATKKKLMAMQDHSTAMQEHAKSLNDGICALLDDGADGTDPGLGDDDTPKAAAAPEAKVNEPATNHSAISSILISAKESFKWTPSKTS